MSTTEKFTVFHTHIAGFWRRSFAFFLDSVLLGLLGYFLGLFLLDYLAGLGVMGRLIGFTVALFYFGLMDSRLFNGQTLGKKAMKIKVVSRNGAALSLPTSFARSAIFCVPYFLNGAPFEMGLIQSWFGTLLSILVFGLGLSIVYMLIFNRQTRQSVHDLAIGAYVVSSERDSAPLAYGKLWRGHIFVMAIILVLAAGAPIFSEHFVGSEPFQSLIALQRDISKEPGVRNVSIFAGTTAFSGSQNGAHSSTNLSIRGVLDSKNTNQEALADRIVQIALSKYPEARNKNIIAVSLVYGYDIGIASTWRAANFVHAPVEWEKRLAAKSGM